MAIDRTGKAEKRLKVINDPDGRAVPVYVLVNVADLKRGQSFRVTTTTVTTIEIIRKKKPPKTIASVRPGVKTKRFRPKKKQ